MQQIILSELTFQAIVEATPNAILLVNNEGRIAYTNNRTEKLFGYEKSELIGQFVEVLIPERYHKNHPQFRQMFFKAPETTAIGSGRDLFACKKDKTEFPVEIGLNPLATITGTMVLVSIIDITERKKAEERFRLVVESAPDAMILTNTNGDITLINAQTEKLFGYERKELIGQKLEILIPERFKHHHEKLRDSFFNAPSVRAMGAGRELYALRKDGSEFPVEIGLNPIETDDGKKVLASIIDITERKKHESIIKNQMIELEYKNKELEQFNYIASHDLQEPLRTVSNYIQVLEEDFQSDINPEMLKYLHNIKKATSRMSTLVRSLLTFSRLGRNKKLVVVNCNLLLENVVNDLTDLIQKSNSKININELPFIDGYEVELHQLFQNLINNAIKFRKPDLDPIVNIDYSIIAGGFQFTVSDNGIGIERKNFNKVFHIFSRLNKENEYEGYGIGLANCKKIVEMHGGKIWIESEVGNGTSFKFTLINQKEYEQS